MYQDSRPFDNPLNWSFRIGQVFGIAVRVHIAFVLCAVVLVWMELPKDGEPPVGSLVGVIAEALGTYALLFLIVLLHEFGHCFGARHTGGEADEILLWPLGGLAQVSPPHRASAHMITTIAGPAVNVVICTVVALALVLWTGSLGAVPWNPLHPMSPVDATLWFTMSTGQEWLVRCFGLSYFLLLINMLPIFPFDGGRVVQAWLWPKKGYASSMMIATFTGMVGAIIIGLIGLFAEQSWLLMMIAVFGYMTCYQTRRQLREQEAFGEGEFAFGSVGGGIGLDVGREDTPPKPGFFERRRLRVQEKKDAAELKRREDHQRAVEAALRKISDTGMDSLTDRERRVLEEETERHRR